ncbi:MAG: glycoside hydrolase, partial [Mycobacterium sp.]
MNARRSAVGKSRWSALAATVVISAGMLYAQVNERPRRPPAPTASATPPTSALPTPAAAAHTATPEEVGALAANAPVAAQQFQLALSAGVASEDR